MKATSWILSGLTAVALAACGGGAEQREATGGADMETGTDAGTMADTTMMAPGATDTLADTAAAH